MNHNWTSESKVITIWICPNLLCWILSVSIYYESQSDIWVKIYGRLNVPRASLLNFERLSLLWTLTGHPSQKLWSFEFVQRFYVQFRVSRYIMGYNQTFESKFMTIWIFCSFCVQFWAFRYIMGINHTFKSKVMAISIFLDLPCWILSVSIYYGP